MGIEVDAVMLLEGRREDEDMKKEEQEKETHTSSL
jgi:hypothetical protein